MQVMILPCQSTLNGLRGEANEYAGFVEEEIFENERYQPFRAWGHTWPGHFLPTDRVGHWSLASPPANTALDTSDFDAVAPFLKKVSSKTKFMHSFQYALSMASSWPLLV